MKYVTMETEHGQKLPILFPDCLTHSVMAMCVAAGIEVCVKAEAKPVSAGFVGIYGPEAVKAQGESESLGLGSAEADTGRIVLGDAVMMMPDAFVMNIMTRMAP